MKAVLANSASTEIRELAITLPVPSSIAWPSILAAGSDNLLGRMFRDPRALGPSERGDLIAQLRSALEIEPHVPELRVLLGMALCVDLQPQEALEQLRDATLQAPECFIAHLKFGELLMRLRICDQAAVETQRAAQLASNAYQSELARKQAATLRTMLREGIERGGYSNILSRLIPFRRRTSKPDTTTVLAASR